MSSITILILLNIQLIIIIIHVNDIDGIINNTTHNINMA